MVMDNPGRRRLARRLGLDGNPLRRRTDKIAICLAALLLAGFFLGAPLLSMAAIGWVGRAEAAGLRAERSPAALLTTTPAAAMVPGHSRDPARLTAPGGPERTGQIPVSTGLSAGRPWRHHIGLVTKEAVAALVVTVALGIVLLSLAWAGRWLLDRRRLAGWEREWDVAGPRWAKRFR